MQIIRYGTEQFEMIVSGEKYSVINILDSAELARAMEQNSVDFLMENEVPETEYHGESQGRVYYDQTEDVFYAVRTSSSG